MEKLNISLFLEHLRRNGISVPLENEIKINNLVLNKISELSYDDVSFLIASVCASNELEHHRILTLYKLYGRNITPELKLREVNKRRYRKVILLTFSTIFLLCLISFSVILSKEALPPIPDNPTNITNSSTENNPSGKSSSNSEETENQQKQQENQTINFQKKHFFQIVFFSVVYGLILYFLLRTTPKLSLTTSGNQHHNKLIFPNIEKEDIDTLNHNKKKRIDIVKTIEKKEKYAYFTSILYKNQRISQKECCIILERKSANDHQSILLEQKISSACDKLDINCHFFYFVSSPKHPFNKKRVAKNYNQLVSSYRYVFILSYPSTLVSDITGQLKSWTENITEITSIMTFHPIANPLGIETFSMSQFKRKLEVL